MNSRFAAYADSQAKDIPNQPGIYAFYLSPFIPYGLGVYGRGSSYSEEQLEKIKNNIREKIEKVSSFVSQVEMVAEVSSCKEGQLSTKYKLHGKEIPNNYLLKSISELSDMENLEWVYMVNDLALYAQPIYVGVTVKQTLNQRYIQHRKNFQNGDSGFGKRLKEAGFAWDEVTFVCTPSNKGVESKMLFALEDFLHTFAKPILSEK